MWLLRCLEAAFIPAAIAVAEARQRAGQILSQVTETVQRVGAIARAGTGFS